MGIKYLMLKTRSDAKRFALMKDTKARVEPWVSGPVVNPAEISGGEEAAVSEKELHG